MPRFSKELRDRVVGNPWGDVYPRRDEPYAPTHDGRTAGLRVLRKYLSELTFYRPGAEGCPPIAFKIPEERIFDEWPEDESKLIMPSLAILAQGPVPLVAVGLNTNVDEDSADVHAPGTVVVILGEHDEDLSLELWSDSKPERRAVLAGIELALAPLEQMSGIRFRCPDYLGQLVVFAQQSKEYVDDDMAVLARRKGKIVVNMRINVVRLVNVSTLNPIPVLSVDADEDTGEEVELDDDGSPDAP